MVKKHSERDLFINFDNRAKIIGLLLKKEAEFHNSKDENKKMTSLFIKTYLSCLAPYPSDQLIKFNEIP